MLNWSRVANAKIIKDIRTDAESDIDVDIDTIVDADI